MKKLLALKKVLIDRDITTLRIAHDLEISPSLFSMWTNGWQRMPDFRKEEIAKYLGIEPSEIFEDYL